jgi:hypothetical protein
VIAFLPEVSETLVVAHHSDEVLQRIMEVTSTRAMEIGEPSKILAGWVKEDRFQLIIRQRRPNSFMPMVEGRVDRTSTGCIVFLQYKLMAITRMYLLLWTVIAFISGTFLAIYYQQVLLGLGCVGIIVLIYAVAWANFKIHHQPLRAIIHKVMES